MILADESDRVSEVDIESAQGSEGDIEERLQQYTELLDSIQKYSAKLDTMREDGKYFRTNVGLYSYLLLQSLNWNWLIEIDFKF